MSFLQFDVGKLMLEEANDPNLFISRREFIFQVKDWHPRLSVEVEPCDHAIVILSNEHALFAESYPCQIRSLADWAVALIHCFELVFSVNDEASKLLDIVDWQSGVINYNQQVFVSCHCYNEAREVLDMLLNSCR